MRLQYLYIDNIDYPEQANILRENLYIYNGITYTNVFVMHF